MQSVRSLKEPESKAAGLATPSANRNKEAESTSKPVKAKAALSKSSSSKATLKSRDCKAAKRSKPDSRMPIASKEASKGRVGKVAPKSRAKQQNPLSKSQKKKGAQAGTATGTLKGSLKAGVASSTKATSHKSVHGAASKVKASKPPASKTTRARSAQERLQASVSVGSGLPPAIPNKVIPLLVSAEHGRKLQAQYKGKLQIVQGGHIDEEITGSPVNNIHTANPHTPRSDRFKDTGHWGIASKDLWVASRHPHIGNHLPWRYRTPTNLVRLRQHPTPFPLPVNVLGSWLEPSITETLKAGLMKRFGGRCQSCGGLNINSKGHQIAPELLAAWDHVPHINSTRKVGMRILKGVAALCATCRTSTQLTELRHDLDSPLVPTSGLNSTDQKANDASISSLVDSYLSQAVSIYKASCKRSESLAGGQMDRQSKAAGNIHYQAARSHPLLWLATHNRWPLESQDQVNRIRKWMGSAISSAADLDDYQWFIDLRWLYEREILAAGEDLPLSRRQKSRVEQVRPGVLVLK